MSEENNNTSNGQSPEKPTSNVQGPTSQYVQNSDQSTGTIRKKDKD